MILGDFNAHHRAWGSSRDDPRGRAIMRICEKYDLIVLNDGSDTYISGQRRTAIDLSLCSSSIIGHLRWHVHRDPAGSDHCPIEILGNDSPPCTGRRRRWIFDRANWEAFESNIDSQIEMNREYSAVELGKIIVGAAKQHIPRTSKTPGRQAVPWWSDEVKNAIKLRRKALRVWKRTKSDDPFHDAKKERWLEARRVCRSIIKQAKESSWQHFIDGISPKSSTQEIWQRLNALRGKRRFSGFQLKVDGHYTDNPKDIADELGKYFSSISSSALYSESFLAKKTKIEVNPTS